MPGSRNNMKETHYERSFTFNDEVLQQIIQTTKKTFLFTFVVQEISKKQKTYSR